MTARRLAALVLLLALGARASVPLAAERTTGTGHGHHASGGHHPGCPWHERGEPCPHAPRGGPSLAACADGALAGGVVSASPALPAGSVPAGRAAPSRTAAPRACRPVGPESHEPPPDPPPPRYSPGR